MSFSRCIETIKGYIDILKQKLAQDDLRSSLNEIFTKDSNRRYLVDFYILFQIMQRLEHSKLTEISYNNLQSKMAKIKMEINSPSNLDDRDSQQQYFERLLDEVSAEG